MLETLKAATFEVFETMFFLFPETPLLAPPIWRGPGLRAWVPVAGPKPFRIGLTVPAALARKMAANFLGQELHDPTPEQVEDAVREGANMVAGNFLGREGAAAIFRIQPPHSAHLDLGNPSFQLSPNRVVLMVEDDGLEVFLERT